MRAEIYLAGGCFWGSEKYLASIPGVLETEVGYANGTTANPTYDDVCRRGTDHAETVRVVFDDTRLSLAFLLSLYYDAVDPLSVNRQGGDRGRQYRTGIYYTDTGLLSSIQASFQQLEEKLGQKPAIEIAPLRHFYPAEDYHQKYLDKNPGGYCHIGKHHFDRASRALVDPASYTPPTPEALHQVLSPLQFQVTQNSATEPPFKNAFWDNHEAGLYVDITTGEPLFVSSDKFDSGCGWPSFTQPLDPAAVVEYGDNTHGLRRTEVRSRSGDAHLGHVFTDGPPDRGGLRYCINSAALRFIPKAQMAQEGYGYLLEYVK